MSVIDPVAPEELRWDSSIPPVMLGATPNITGGLNIPNGSEVSGNNYFQTEGCFLYEGRTNPFRRGNTQNPGEGGRIAVSATMSSSIFGESTSVQPSSLCALACIKF